MRTALRILNVHKELEKVSVSYQLRRYPYLLSTDKLLFSVLCSSGRCEQSEGTATRTSHVDELWWRAAGGEQVALGLVAQLDVGVGLVLVHS